MSKQRLFKEKNECKCQNNPMISVIELKFTQILWVLFEKT